MIIKKSYHMDFTLKPKKSTQNIVLKTEPNRPVWLVKPSTDELSDSVHLNEPFRGQTGIEQFKSTVEPPNRTNRPVFTNRRDLNSTNICLLLRDPLSIMSIPRSVLLKLKLIISPYLVQATKAQSNDKKTYKTFT